MKMVKVFVAIKRKLQPGDKMAGRHGNKGVVSRILPVEDMPFLEDGTHADIVLNPLGVPSRMNVGQILETHLGWACAGMGRKIGDLLDVYQKQGDIKPLRSTLEKIYGDNDRNEPVKNYDDDSVVRLADQLTRGVSIATPVFDGAHEADIVDMLKDAGLDPSGQSTLYDGRTGEAFDRQVTNGVYFICSNFITLLTTKFTHVPLVLIRWLPSSRWVVRLNLVGSVLVKWRSGRLKHTVLPIPSRKC